MCFHICRSYSLKLCKVKTIIPLMIEAQNADSRAEFACFDCVMDAPIYAPHHTQ